jgi:hypothetical protein
MRIGPRTLLVLALLALTQLSCATVALTPDNESMPAARLGLPYEQRIFFDALQGYGDWMLIEPLGYVFRPYDSDEYWHPYLYGYWAPSEMYGWVWISSEPYGWATYHYGTWYYDDYQGWVWIPGSDWGPAWVSWVMTDDYAGWAPLFPPGYSPDLAPGGGYLYVTIASLAAPDLPRLARTPAQLGVALGVPIAVDDFRERSGVVFNAGPAFSLVERRSGPLTRVKLEDLSPAPDAGVQEPSRPARPAPPALATPEPAAGGRRAPARGPGTSPPVGVVRRSGEAAAQRARSVTERGTAPPPTVGILRPDLRREDARRVPPTAPPVGRPRPVTSRGAGADSTKRP